MDQDLLVVLRTRIDQHLKFFETLERIRWQFTTAFGAGAGAAIFFALDDKGSVKKLCVALLLVVGFSVAGLIAQLRIFGLIVVLWNRMATLQAKEFDVLKDGIEGERTELQKALSFPRLGGLSKWSSAHTDCGYGELLSFFIIDWYRHRTRRRCVLAF